MSVLEMHLKEAKKTKGMYHKIIIQNLRGYIEAVPEREVISQINQLKDISLIPFLWEAGLNDNLQKISNKRSMLLLKAGAKEVK